MRPEAWIGVTIHHPQFVKSKVDSMYLPIKLGKRQTLKHMSRGLNCFSHPPSDIAHSINFSVCERMTQSTFSAMALTKAALHAKRLVKLWNKVEQMLDGR